MTQAAMTLTRDQMKAYLRKRPRGYSIMMGVPDGVSGNRVPLEQIKGQMWSPQVIWKNHLLYW